MTRKIRATNSVTDRSDNEITATLVDGNRQEFGTGFNTIYEQPVACARTGDVEELPFGFVDIVEFNFV